MIVAPALLNGSGASTTWTNLGDWSASPDYPVAAEALAARVGAAARLASGQAVLDAGCGPADSCALWLRRFGVQHVTGVEQDPQAIALARANLARWRFERQVTLVQGDATRIAPTPGRPFDAVVAVDAAYHFAPRDRFLAAAAACLRPRGRLAFTDLAAIPSDRDHDRLERLAKASRIPQGNLWTEAQFTQQLTRAGFRDITIQRLDTEVLHGFTKFALRHPLRFATRKKEGGWAVLGTAAFTSMVRRWHWASYLLISATRP